jgi:hypothetical protein
MEGKAQEVISKRRNEENFAELSCRNKIQGAIDRALTVAFCIRMRQFPLEYPSL